MNPWTAIGWIVLFVMVGTVVGVVSGTVGYAGQWLVRRGRRFLAYRKTRDVAFAKNQWWGPYRITDVWTREELGEKWKGSSSRDLSKLPKTVRLGIRNGGTSWGEDAESFREHIRRQRLHMDRG